MKYYSLFQRIEANATNSRVAEMGGPEKPETPIGLPNFEVAAHESIELKEWKREARYNNQYEIKLENAQHYDRQIDQ